MAAKLDRSYQVLGHAGRICVCLVDSSAVEVGDILYKSVSVSVLDEDDGPRTSYIEHESG